MSSYDKIALVILSYLIKEFLPPVIPISKFSDYSLCCTVVIFARYSEVFFENSTEVSVCIRRYLTCVCIIYKY